jgi:hypothetical protein
MRRAPSPAGSRRNWRRRTALFAAWNATIYGNQTEDQRIDAVVSRRGYLATQAVLHAHGGLWLNDESLRRRH